MSHPDLPQPVSRVRRTGSRRSGVVRMVAFSVVLLVAAWVGRATFLESAGLSLVWPASGIGIIWVASSNRRTLPTDLVALAVITALIIGATAGTLGQSLLGGVLAVVQPLVYLLVMRRLAPSLWGSGGTRAFARVADVGPFLVACASASAVTSVLRWTGLGLVPPGELLELALVGARNFAWMVAIASVALQLAPALVSSGSPRELMRRVRTALLAPADPHGLEAGAIVLVTAVFYVAVFARSSEFPSTFLLMLTTVWAAVRLTPASAGLQTLVSGATAVLYTLHDRGAFVSLSDPRSSALLAQLFLIVLSITAMTLAFSIAERVEAMARAAASEHAEAERAALLSAVLQSMQEGVEVVQADGRALVRNPSGRRLLGLAEPPTPVSGDDHAPRSPVPDVAHTALFSSDGARVPHDRLPFVRALAGEDVVAEDYWVHRPDTAARRILEVTATPVPGLAGSERHRAVVTFRDVTVDRRDRDNLAAFAGVVAHDLFSPLGVVGGWADVLADSFAEGPLDPGQGLEMVARIQGGAAQMRHFIQDLLAYTVARDRPLDVQELDLTELAERIAGLRREGGARPVIEIQPRMRVNADPALVRQLIENLLSNAVKYVAPGVRPRIRMTAETRGPMLEIRVTDNGIGIPTEHRARIFDDFHRAHPVGYSGTGIGLAICRRAVERHEGRIHVHDGPELNGSTFVFTLPR